MSHSCTSLGGVTNVGELIHLYCPNCWIFGGSQAWFQLRTAHRLPACLQDPSRKQRAGGCSPVHRAIGKCHLFWKLAEHQCILFPSVPIPAPPSSCHRNCWPGAGESPWERKKMRKKHKRREKNWFSPLVKPLVFTSCDVQVSSLAPCFALQSQIAPCPVLSFFHQCYGHHCHVPCTGQKEGESLLWGDTTGWGERQEGVVFSGRDRD